MYLRCEGQRFTLIIDQTKNLRFFVRWEEEYHVFDITFATLQEAQNFAEGWLDLVELAGGKMFAEPAQESSLPSGKDCMGFIALVGLLVTLVLLLYLFG
jgi:hypothetical protein